MKRLQPLPHAVIDYAFSAKMIAAPWLLGFSDNKAATMSSIGSGVAIAGLSLLTDYPLGVIKLIPFPMHGVIETTAGVMTAAAPFMMGFTKNKRATWTHLIAGLTTLAVVAVTDYTAKKRRRQNLETLSRGKLIDWSYVPQSKEVA
jgi:hypothetical protein